jgi:hypothetical protein
VLHFCELQDEVPMDWKAVGYVISMVSVMLIGAVAWPKQSDPAWMTPALMAGMLFSILGMGLRWIAHVQEKKSSVHRR